jgi:hypothetical protein
VSHIVTIGFELARLLTDRLYGDTSEVASEEVDDDESQEGSYQCYRQ